MKFSETVMLGGSCLSAGVVLNGKSDVTVLERGATIGGEYFDTYCPVAPMEQEVRYEPVRQLQEARATSTRTACAGTSCSSRASPEGPRRRRRSQIRSGACLRHGATR